MIKKLLKGMLSSIAVGVMADYRRLSVQLLKAEAAKSYLQVVRTARMLTICRIQVALTIALILLGALLFHVGLFILLPWTLKAKAILGMGLGLGYVIWGVVQLRTITDEALWVEKSGVAKMLADVAGEK